MKRLALLTLGLMLFSLVGFLLINPDQPPTWLDPAQVMPAPNWVSALAGVGILAADVALPVFSSLVMALNGQLFGLWLGALLSLIGGLAAAALGYLLWASGSRWEERLLSQAELKTAHRLINRYGALALVLSRPVPMLAEALTLVAGLTGFGLRRALACSAMGLAPTALAFAALGDSPTAATGGFLAVIAVSGILWWIGKRTLDQASLRP